MDTVKGWRSLPQVTGHRLMTADRHISCSSYPPVVIGVTPTNGCWGHTAGDVNKTSLKNSKKKERKNKFPNSFPFVISHGRSRPSLIAINYNLQFDRETQQARPIFMTNLLFHDLSMVMRLSSLMILLTT